MLKIMSIMKLIRANFEYSLKSADRPKPSAVIRIIRSRQKDFLAKNVLGDSYVPPAETQTKWKKIN